MDQQAPEHHEPESSSGPDEAAPSPMRAFWENWLKPILIVITVLVLFRAGIADWHDVPSGSMRPTILEGDRIVVNKLAYDLRVPFTSWTVARWSDPGRGDVVTFWVNDPNTGSSTRMVKRVVAVGGDEIELRNGQLIINGEPVDYEPVEPAQVEDALHTPPPQRAETLDDQTYTVQLTSSPPRLRNYGPEVVPDGHYFMLGDNRDNSGDSRSFGFVAEQEIIGRAFAVAISFDGSILRPQWSRWFSGID